MVHTELLSRVPYSHVIRKCCVRALATCTGMEYMEVAGVCHYNANTCVQYGFDGDGAQHHKLFCL